MKLSRKRVYLKILQNIIMETTSTGVPGLVWKNPHHLWSYFRSHNSGKHGQIWAVDLSILVVLRSDRWLRSKWFDEQLLPKWVRWGDGQVQPAMLVRKNTTVLLQNARCVCVCVCVNFIPNQCRMLTATVMLEWLVTAVIDNHCHHHHKAAFHYFFIMVLPTKCDLELPD